MIRCLPYRLALLLCVTHIGCGPPAPPPSTPRAPMSVSADRLLDAFRRDFAATFRSHVHAEAYRRGFAEIACAPASLAGRLHPRVLCDAARALARGELVGGGAVVVKQTLAALDALADHAFVDPALPARVATLKQRIEAARRDDATAREVAPASQPSGPTAAELQRLRPFAQRAATAAHRDLMRDAIAADGPTPRIARAFSREVARQRRLRAAQVELQLALGDALVEIAGRFERARLDVARWSITSRRKPAASAPASQATRALPSQPVDPIPDVAAFLRRRLHRLLLALAADPRHDVAAWARGLEPQHPQYRRLLVAYARYRLAARAGGWPLVPRIGRLRVGRSQRHVEALKRRLAAEGYYKGPIDRHVDVELMMALQAFKEAQQISERGLGPAFWRALRRPAAEQAAAIARELRRWRASKTQASSTYVLVNLPSFHLELRKAGRRLFREAVVVGRATGTKCDEETERKVLAFATPELDARIEKLIFAPYWNVTKAIKEKELDAERGKDPLFYEKHGYEVMRAGTPGEWVRELPSPKNALGFVKFIFPNPHAVYVHDTPDKGLFSRSWRAFSHGCMRLQSPRRLARLLLQLDGQYDATKFAELYKRWRAVSFKELQEEWDQERYDKLLKDAEALETTTELKHPVPIHVEYHTVWIDGRGHARFLRDLYRRDDPRPGRRCIPESKRAKRGFQTLLMRVLTLEIQAAQIAPKAEAASAQAGGLKIPAHRWKKRVARLREFTASYKNLVASVRREQQQLNAVLEKRRGRWNDRLVEEAVRIERLVQGLREMQAEALETMAYIERLVRGPSAAGRGAPAASGGRSR